MKLFTKEQLVKKFHGKFIQTLPIFIQNTKTWEYEVIKVSKTIRENCNPPEELK
jgi:hypothetical protein